MFKSRPESPATLYIILMLFIGTQACKNSETVAEEVYEQKKLPLIFDTDANNELDDQHALAYLLFNADTFEIKGVTVNATSSGGDIDAQYAEAERVLKLCRADTLPLLKGANKSFTEIDQTVTNKDFDGYEAVNFIIDQAKAADQKLLVLAVGKLTTVALALVKDSTIAEKIKLVWLGSNYPEPGEYNQDNDTVAMNYILNSRIEFEIATVRYGQPSGTGAVKLTKEEALRKLPGRGVRTTSPITGRHGGEFYTFGDYAVDLFEHIDYDGTPPARALFDMAAVAIVKNPGWAERRTIPAPILIGNKWVERPANKRKVTIWENFKTTEILDDFFKSIPPAK
jgi:purine nucleosidase